MDATRPHLQTLAWVVVVVVAVIAMATAYS
jgi:hypothetical protein